MIGFWFPAPILKRDMRMFLSSAVGKGKEKSMLNILEKIMITKSISNQGVDFKKGFLVLFSIKQLVSSLKDSLILTIMRLCILCN